MIEEMKEEESKEDTRDSDDTDFILDFGTSSAISSISLKFLVLYIPLFSLSGIPVAIFWYEWTLNKLVWTDWIFTILFLPLAIVAMVFIFMASAIFFCKLLMVIINLIHVPKEGIFRAENGDKDFEFWRLRIEIKKIVIFLVRNCPLPWVDVWAFRWFGLKIDFSSHLNDAWVDTEFITFGRKVMVGQGAVIMSSMIVGKYLIIKRVVLDDYVVVGGCADIAPGTIIGKDTVIGAVSTTNPNQLLEDGMIYFGIPAIKLKVNKYHEERKDVIRIVDVDNAVSMEEEHDANIDEDKKHLLETNEED